MPRGRHREGDAAAAGPSPRSSFDGIVTEHLVGDLDRSRRPRIGTWLVDTTKVVVTRMTRLKGDPKVGDKVHVEGRERPTAPSSRA